MVAVPLPGWESSGPWTPPASRSGRGWVALLLAGLVGFAVGAVAVGAVWILTERGGTGGSRGSGPIGPVTSDLGYRPGEVANLVNQAWGMVS